MGQGSGGLLTSLPPLILTFLFSCSQAQSWTRKGREWRCHTAVGKGISQPPVQQKLLRSSAGQKWKPSLAGARMTHSVAAFIKSSRKWEGVWAKLSRALTCLLCTKISGPISSSICSKREKHAAIYSIPSVSLASTGGTINSLWLLVPAGPLTKDLKSRLLWVFLHPYSKSLLDAHESTFLETPPGPNFRIFQRNKTYIMYFRCFWDELGLLQLEGGGEIRPRAPSAQAAHGSNCPEWPQETHHRLWGEQGI